MTLKYIDEISVDKQQDVTLIEFKEFDNTRLQNYAGCSTRRGFIKFLEVQEFEYFECGPASDSASKEDYNGSLCVIADKEALQIFNQYRGPIEHNIVLKLMSLETCTEIFNKIKAI